MSASVKPKLRLVISFTETDTSVSQTCFVPSRAESETVATTACHAPEMRHSFDMILTNCEVYLAVLHHMYVYIYIYRERERERYDET